MALPPMKLAIVGAGPSAFYVASRILSRITPPHPQASALRIHMYDRLWAPHGLVRYGVAPDHPEVKNCTHKFDSTAVDDRFRFFGNVNIGPPSATTPPDTTQLSISSLLKSYTHLLISTGCPAPTLHPSLTPSPYCIPALSLVHWYTQHPSLASIPPPPLDKINHVTIIGNGNVALDIARILLTPPSVLSKYDVPAPVLEILSRSTVKHVSVIARRGPRDAAFTTKELREMMNLSEASMIPVHPPSLLDVPTTTLDALSRQQTRILQLLQKGSVNKPGTTEKTWSLEFFRSPTDLMPPSPSSPKPTLTLSHTNPELTTPETSTLNTDLVITSLGFHPEPTSPFQTRGNGVSFASTSTSTDSSPPTLLGNVYASGWAATGAKGVLAATMINAYGVADTMLTDWLDGDGNDTVTEPKMENVMNPNPASLDLDAVPVEVQEAIDQGNVIDYATWKSIDAEEVRRGEALGKERERMVRWDEVRKFIGRK